MGEHHLDWYPLKMDNADDLFIDLLREWYILATDGLVSIAGEDTSLALMRPYCHNAGEGGAPNIRKITGLNTDDVANLAWFMVGVLGSAGNDGNYRIWSDMTDVAYTENTKCSFKGRNRVACLVFCDMTPQAATNALNRDFEIELISSDIWCDETCRFRINRINKKTSNLTMEEVVRPKLSNELSNIVILAILGELWVMVTKAVIDHSGTEAVSIVLIPNMFTSGQKFGKELLERCSENKIGAPSIHDMIIWLNRVMGRTGTFSEDLLYSQGEISECPLSGSPPEICQQCQSFFNGICDVIDHDFEFKYDRMMTRGDETCHWTMRKRREQECDKFFEDDALKTLRMRLAKGEITPEDYARLKDLLNER